MKKIITLIAFAALLLFGFIGVNGAVKSGETDSIAIGKLIGSSIRDILTGPESNLGNQDSDRVIGTILGEEIIARDLEVRARLFEIAGSEDPLQDAWNSMKFQLYQKQFAKEHNIYPTDQEIMDFTQEQRQMVETAPGGREYAKAIIESAGMTEDQYWNDYKVRKESPAHLTDIKIAEYLTANNLPDLDEEEILKSIKAEIRDRDILKKYN